MPRIDGIFLSPSQEVIVNRITQCKAVCILNSTEEKRMIRQQEKEMTKLQAEVADLKADIEEFKENIRKMVEMITLIVDKNEEKLSYEANNLAGRLDFVKMSDPSSPIANSVATSPIATTTTMPPPPPPQPPIPPPPGSYCIPLSRYLRPNLSPSDYTKSTYCVLKPLPVIE